MRNIWKLALLGLVVGVVGCMPAPTKLQPGKYRVTMTVQAMSAPGMSAEMLQQMQRAPVVNEECMPETDISQMVTGASSQAAACGGQSTIAAANGRISGTSTCQTPAGTQTVQVNGSYNATHLEMTVEMHAHSLIGEVAQKMNLVTERIGECTTP